MRVEGKQLEYGQGFDKARRRSGGESWVEKKNCKWFLRH